MSEQLAFPQHCFTSSPEVAARMADRGGMTMRQYYKAAALQGMLANPDCGASNGGLAQSSAAIADAMLAEDEEREKAHQAISQQAHLARLNSTSAAGGLGK